jgi:ankyrin repeat protein
MTTWPKAVASNNVDAVRAFLDGGYDPNTSLQNNGTPALESVLSFGFQSMAELLFSRGARVRPGTGLDAASFSGNLPLLQWVYSNGVDVQVNSSINFLAARTTSEETKLAIAEYFISIGANPQAWAEASMTIPGCLAVAKMLVSRGLFDAKAKTSTIRRGGLVDERVSIEDFLALRKIDHPYTLAVLPDGSNALFVAIRDNDLAKVQALLAASPAPNLTMALHASTGNPLVYATKRGNASIVSALIAAGAQGADVATMVSAAVDAGSAAVLGPLLAMRPPPPVATLTAALHRALISAHVTVVYMLLAAGASVSTLVDGVPALARVPLIARTTPLEAKPDHVALMYAMLSAGANPDVYVNVLYGTVKAYCLKTSPALAAAVGWS